MRDRPQSSDLQFGDAERRAALRLMEWALAEDLGVANAGQLPICCDSLPTADINEAFSISTLDTSNAVELIAAQTSLCHDLTCEALLNGWQHAELNVVARRDGRVAGGPIAPLVFQQLDSAIAWNTLIADGAEVNPGAVVAQVAGPLKALLIGERTTLNFLTHLSGIATLTRQFVDAVAGTRAAILDTRKTLPGWRTLAKYAVRCGGGTNHRHGLYDGVLVKDNHLAAWAKAGGSRSIADAVRQARERSPQDIRIEVEVDTLDQLRDALAGNPDIVLLDNMQVPKLREAVALRDQLAPRVSLEASGGITLANVRAIAETGVDRISIGALTHSAPALDLAFDWGR